MRTFICPRCKGSGEGFSTGVVISCTEPCEHCDGLGLVNFPDNFVEVSHKN